MQLKTMTPTGMSGLWDIAWKRGKCVKSERELETAVICTPSPKARQIWGINSSHNFLTNNSIYLCVILVTRGS